MTTNAAERNKFISLIFNLSYNFPHHPPITYHLFGFTVPVIFSTFVFFEPLLFTLIFFVNEP